MNSRHIRFGFTFVGVGLLAWLFTQVDTSALVREVLGIGIGGFAIILAIYCVEFVLDVLSWQLTLKTIPVSLPWTMRLFMARIAGEAYNVITPLGGMGGEPVKALILHRRYEVPYAVSGASLVLAKTMNVFALVLFLGVGFFMILDDSRISTELKIFAAAGLLGLGTGIGGFMVVQRLQLASRIAGRLQAKRPALAKLLAELEVFDHYLSTFYTGSPTRFAAVFTLSFGSWIVGALGVWATMYLLDNPISLRDAWIIEAMTQMVRAATFFIPASIGAQEGTIMLFSAAITGQAGSGLAVALLRRAREVLWVLCGLAVSAKILGRVNR